MKYSIFLSYRRSTGLEKTRLLKMFLEKCGYSVFMDQDKINKSKPFPEELEGKVKECTDFILVLTKGSLAYRAGGTDFLYEEMLHAYTCYKNSNEGDKCPRLHIVAEAEVNPAEYGEAYAEQVPEKYAEALEFFCKLTPLDVLDFSGRDEAILSWIQQTMQRELKSTLEVDAVGARAEDGQSGYVVGNQERERLARQGEITYEQDQKILGEIFSNFKGLRRKLAVLDVGCADGQTGKRYFENNAYVAKVVGIDRDQNLICKAMEAEQGKPKTKFVYKQLDLSAEDFDEQLNKIKEKHQIENFDIIFCCQVLHHVAKPKTVLEKLNNHLKKGGCLIIRASDDGSKMIYSPDNHKENASLMNDIVKLTTSLPTMADRFPGRKLMSYLTHIELLDVRVVPITTASSMVPAAERCAFLSDAFKESFSWRYYIFEDKNKHTSDEYLESEQKMKRLLDRLKSLFDNPGCWYCSTDYLGFGFKK